MENWFKTALPYEKKLHRLKNQSHSHYRKMPKSRPLKNQLLTRPTAVDCFAGCGGLSEGLRQAGFKIVAGIEIKQEARQTHQLNHPEAILYEDITKTKAEDLLSDAKLKVGELDLLAGCPPCQGFSSMRTLNGSKEVFDPRNELIFNFTDLAIELQPKVLLIENVPALLNDSRIEKAKQSLKKAGYNWIKAEVRDASSFNVPQRRKRMILIASRLGPIDLPSGDSSKVQTVRQAIGNLGSPEKSSKVLHRLVMNNGPTVRKRLEKIPKDGGSRSSLPKREQLKCHRSTNGFSDVYGRMKWDDVSPTITRFCNNPSKGRFVHPEQNRAISIYEALKLQSFPSNYKFPSNLSMGKLASMIGEALPPAFAKAQGEHILDHLKELR